MGSDRWPAAAPAPEAEVGLLVATTEVAAAESVAAANEPTALDAATTNACDETRCATARTLAARRSGGVGASLGRLCPKSMPWKWRSNVIRTTADGGNRRSCRATANSKASENLKFRSAPPPSSSSRVVCPTHLFEKRMMMNA